MDRAVIVDDRYGERGAASTDLSFSAIVRTAEHFDGDFVVKHHRFSCS
jgi:hypothetical protein